MADLLIRNGRVMDPESGIDGILDIYVQDGIIEQIGSDLSDYQMQGIETIDATGQYVVPGLIDIHCHLREPGFEYKEDIETGTKSAAKGGFTSVACMPNTNPVIDDLTVVQYIQKRAAEAGAVHVLPIGSITCGLGGEQLAPIGELKFAGAVAVSDDGRPVRDAKMMSDGMTCAKLFDIPVISHCEDLDLAGHGSMNEGEVSEALGLQGIPRTSEEVMVARELVLADALNTRIHIAHVSTKGSVALVRDAKKTGHPSNL